MSETAKARKTSSFSYALGMFGTSIPINMFRTWALTFYVDKLTYITTAQFATITLIYTFLDAIDKERERKGNRYGYK